MGCVSGLKCERKSLFSCLHFQRISDFLFWRVFCDIHIYIYIYIYRQTGMPFDSNLTQKLVQGAFYETSAPISTAFTHSVTVLGVGSLSF